MNWYNTAILAAEIVLAIVLGSLIGWLVAYWRGRHQRPKAELESSSTSLPPPDLVHPAPPSETAESILSSVVQLQWPAILEAAGEGLLLLDANQTVLLANRTVGEFFGMAPEGLHGRKFWELIQHRPLLDALEHVQLGATVHAEVTVHYPRERILRLHLLVPRGSTVSSEARRGGAMTGQSLRPPALPISTAPRDVPSGITVIIVRDVTELRRLEQYRREFLANVSHELKTPLTAIQAAAETLQAALCADPQSASRFVQHILDNAQRLHRLVQDMLQLARLEAGQQTWHKEAVCVAEVVQDVVERHQARAQQKGLALQIVSEYPELRTWVDAEALVRILENLLDNAIKYTARGSISIRWWPAENHVVLEIADTGEGIAPENLPRIFERFYRVDKGRSRDQGGSGLGLAIVKHLVHAMDGVIHVQSQLGVGTRFTVRLPGAEAASPIG
ncbi:MAG: ATP-binding protein [Gemmatales bacterium]|nr:ATP-binding protein [Gemmatales bacterium]